MSFPSIQSAMPQATTMSESVKRLLRHCWAVSDAGRHSGFRQSALSGCPESPRLKPRRCFIEAIFEE